MSTAQRHPRRMSAPQAVGGGATATRPCNPGPSCALVQPRWAHGRQHPHLVLLWYARAWGRRSWRQAVSDTQRGGVRAALTARAVLHRRMLHFTF